MNDNIRKSSFYPVGSLKGKSNFKKYITIHNDGFITENVLLNVIDPSEREKIICFHYMRHMTRNFYKKDIGVNVLSRDSPWDFKLQFSTGEIINVEITSVANVREHFIINKNEERFLQWKSKKTIPLHELEKLNRLFPNADINKTIDSLKSSGFSSDSNVENPLYKNEGPLFISNMPKRKASFVEIVQQAIDKKFQKSHVEKEKTVLLIDNRTSTFEVSDYEELVEGISEYCSGLPFPEVWFYTGYYSDNDGSNAEFSFSPLKATTKQWEVLEQIANSYKTDGNGRYFW
jgi:hypothetical protein|tara:strand:+ start:959 stop:1825 length:867 start_codon:yes stop_codon:yes gene_type:complete